MALVESVPAVTVGPLMFTFSVDVVPLNIGEVYSHVTYIE
jgi:hypothetical protein